MCILALGWSDWLLGDGRGEGVTRQHAEMEHYPGEAAIFMYSCAPLLRLLLLLASVGRTVAQMT